MSRKRMDNTTTQAIEQPASITYNSPNYTGPAVVAVAFVLLSCPFAWWTGTFLFDRAGYYEPDKALASFVLVFIGTFAGLALVIAAGVVIGRYVLSDVLAHRERMKELDVVKAEKEAEAARYLQLTAARPVPSGRVMADDQRFVRILEAVMFQAYDYLAKHGEFIGQGRPWSRRSVLAVQLSDSTHPTEREAADVRGWLVQRGIVREDQVNVRRFPDLASFQELLYREYDRPVLVAGNFPTLRDNAGYQHI